MSKNRCRYCGHYPGPVCDSYDCNMREGLEDIEAMERAEAHDEGKHDDCLPRECEEAARLANQAESDLRMAEFCPNGRRHVGSHQDPEFYKYDMSDDEWHG